MDILSLFPSYFDSPFGVSMLQRAQKGGKLQIRQTDIRKFGEGKHKKVDDRPFGGGPGMVLLPGPVVQAIRSVRREGSHVIYLSPQGTPLTAKKCQELANFPHLILLCGHYEGVDERAIESEVTEEISIGDFVLTSGCPAALVLVDAVSRFIPGVIGHPEAVWQDSFMGEEELFDAPLYTGPPVFEGREVPIVLRQGDHQKIARWRLEKSKEKTLRVRPEKEKQ